jgi:microcystin-dependent protein
MSQPFIGEIRMFAGNFPPAGWEFCNGQLLPISENDALFQLIGTTYGGDGQSTFGLPDLRGRVPMHMGTGAGGITYIQGEMAGVESVTLTTQQIPIHTHPLVADVEPATAVIPGDTVLLAESEIDLYQATSPNTNMHAGTVSPVGGSQPHDNMMPYLAISFIISLFGIFPPPN